MLSNREKDVEELKVLLEEVIQELAVPRQLVTDEFTKYDVTVFPLLASQIPYHTRFCFSELSPVCAIVGGIYAQEVIKVISLQIV